MIEEKRKPNALPKSHASPRSARQDPTDGRGRGDGRGQTRGSPSFGRVKDGRHVREPILQGEKHVELQQQTHDRG